MFAGEEEFPKGRAGVKLGYLDSWSFRIQSGDNRDDESVANKE